MKKTLILMLCVVLVLCCTLVVACDLLKRPTPPTPDTNNPVSVTITGAPQSETYDYSYAQNTLQLGATITYEDANREHESYTLQWSSSKQSVATVSNSGLVTFCGDGDVTITVKVVGFNSVTANVKIKAHNTDGDNIVPVEVTISNKPATTYYFNDNNKEINLATIVELSNGEQGEWEIVWTTSAEEVAIVDQDGKLTFVGVGEVTVTATAKDSSVKDEFIVNVLRNGLTITGIPQDRQIDIYGETHSVTLGYEYVSGTGTVIWSSSNEKVATVSDSGVVTALAIGKTVIKATSSNDSAVSDEFELSVVDSDSAWSALGGVNPAYKQIDGTDSYVVSAVKKSTGATFLSEDANVGLRIAKESSANELTNIELGSTISFQKNTTYFFSFVVEQIGASSPWGSLRIGFEGLTSSVEAIGLQPSLYDYCTKGKYAIAGAGSVMYVATKTETAVDGGTIWTVEIAFATGDKSIENATLQLLANFGDKAGSYTITNISVNKLEGSELSKQYLSGINVREPNARQQADDIYLASEITEGFNSVDTDAVVGIKFSKEVTTNVYSDWNLTTNQTLKANTTYKFAFAIEGFANGPSAWGGFGILVKNVTKQSGNLGSPWAYGNATDWTGIDGAQIISHKVTSATNEGDSLYCGEVIFITGATQIDNAVISIRVNFGSSTGCIILTKVEFEEIIPSSLEITNELGEGEKIAFYDGGEPYQINTKVTTASGTEIGADIVWTSSDESIATVANGKVTFKQVGTVTIKATLATNAEIFDEIVLTSELQMGTLTGIAISNKPTEKIYLKDVAKTLQLNVTPSYENGELPQYALVWSSSDEDKATVSQQGVVTFVNEGTVTITVKVDGNESLTDSVELELSNLIFEITGKPSESKVDMYTMKAMPKLGYNYFGASINSVVWTSSDTSVATVAADGEVTVIKDGKTTIRVANADNAEQYEEFELTVLNTNPSKDVDPFFGIGEVSHDMLATQQDALAGNEFCADMMGLMGAKTTRIWIYVGYFVSVDANNNVTLQQSNVAALHDYINKLQAQGVTNIIGLVCEYQTPYGYIDANKSKSGTVVVAPNEAEYDTFLALTEDIFSALATEFHDISLWEAGNEPQLSKWFHSKDGEAFSDATMAQIISDYCYHARKGIKSAYLKNQLVLPGLVDGEYTGISTSTTLNAIYNYIGSATDSNPDNYFDYLAWHPYPQVKSSGDVSKFVADEKALLAIVNEHDQGKQVIYTEFGFSASRFGSFTQEQIATYALNCVKAIKQDEQLSKFVNSIVWFRLSNNIKTGSDFGLFNSPNDSIEKAALPTKLAQALYMYFNGKDNANAIINNKYAYGEDILEVIDNQLAGVSLEGAQKTGTGVYNASIVATGFHAEDTTAQVGIKFAKESTANSYSTWELKTNQTLKANTKYTLTFNVDYFSGNPDPWATFRLGIKDVFRSSEGNFPASGWDIGNHKLAGLNGVTIIASSGDYTRGETAGCMYYYSITFMTGSSDVENAIIELNINYQTATGYVILTKLAFEEQETVLPQSLFDSELAGARTEGSQTTGAGVYTASEVTSGFCSVDTTAQVGIKFEKTSTNNSYGEWLFDTNQTLKANTKYKFTFAVDQFEGGASANGAFSILINDVVSQPANLGSVWAYGGATDWAGVNGVTLISHKNGSLGSADIVRTGELVFVTGTSDIVNPKIFVRVNLGTGTGKLILTSIKFEEQETVLPQSLFDSELAGARAEGSRLTGGGVYEATEVTTGFHVEDTNAQVGIKFAKESTVNSSSTWELKTNQTLKANTKYTLTFNVDKYDGMPDPWTTFRLGIKDVFKSSEGNFPANGWDIANKKLAGLNGVVINTASGDYTRGETAGCMYYYSITFTTGSSDITNAIIELNINFQTATGYVTLTKLAFEELETVLPQSLFDDNLAGARAEGSRLTGGGVYEATEVTTGFHVEDTTAQVGIKFAKESTVNSSSTWELKTNQTLKANTKYTLTFNVDYFSGNPDPWATFRLDIKDVFRSSEGNFPAHGPDFRDKKILGLNGTVINASSAAWTTDQATAGCMYYYSITFTTGSSDITNAIIELNINFQTATGYVTLTKLAFEEVGYVISQSSFDERLAGINVASVEQTKNYYSLSAVSDGFCSVDPDAKVGIMIEKTDATNIYVDLVLTTTQTLKANTKYEFTFTVDQFEGGVSANGAFGLLLKDVVTQPGNLGSIWAYGGAGDWAGANGVTLHSHTNGTVGSTDVMRSGKLVFTMGESDVSNVQIALRINFGTSTGKLILTSLSFVEVQ